MSWTLQAPDGEFNIRIASGLMIGEDAQGNLEITPTGQTALVRFEVEDGALRIRLMSRAWALTRNNKMMGDSLRNERTAELHLPNNVIRIVGGENSAVEPERIELTPRVSMRWLLPTPERTEEVPVEAVQPPPVQATEDIAEPELEAWPEEPIENPEHVDVPIQPAQPAQPTRQSEHYEPAITVTPTEILPVRLPSRRRRVLSPLMAALFGLGGGIAVALLYQTLSREPTTASNTAPTTDAGSSAIQASASPPHPAENTLATTESDDGATAPAGSVERSPEQEAGAASLPVAAPAAKAAQIAPGGSASSIDEATASAAPTRTSPVSPPVKDMRPTTAPEDREVAVATNTAERSPNSPPVSVPVERPAPAPEVRPSTRQVVQIAGAAAVSGSQAIDSQQKPMVQPKTAVQPKSVVQEKTTVQPKPAVVAKQRKPDAAELAQRARAAEQTRAGLLRAGDVALAQGRLMTPTETSAYTFYKKVLALDPKSAEALGGLKSVRQGLINRALADLAMNELDGARSSLQAAANAGVNPALVADLRGEVEYRQRLSDARDGVFKTLYPADQLVAISRQPPRLPRTVAAGAQTFVEIHFTVTTGGEVRDVKVINTPPVKLVREVRRAVSEWRFEPVLFKGRPIPVRTSVRFDVRK